jgi:hypothetical protein
MTTSVKEEPTTKVINIEDEMPYVAPPVEREVLFREELKEHAEMYWEEAKYHRELKQWDRADCSSDLYNMLSRVARKEDPEAAATQLLYDMSYQMEAIRDAIKFSRKTVMRAEEKANKAKWEAAVEEAAAARKAEVQNTEQVIKDLREKIAATKPASKEIVKAAQTIEVATRPKA